jgi:hypothetical protein
MADKEVFDSIRGWIEWLSVGIAIIGSALWNQVTTRRLKNTIFGPDDETLVRRKKGCLDLRAECLKNLNSMNDRHHDEMSRIFTKLDSMDKRIEDMPEKTISMLRNAGAIGSDRKNLTQ